MSSNVLLTDHAWPDTTIEKKLLEEAGLRLVSAGTDPAPVAEIERLVAEHDPIAIMTCWAQVSSKAIAAASRLRVVTRLGVGLDNIAVEAASARGVRVTNVPDYCVEEVSDHAVAMALNWTRGISLFDRDVRSGHWRPSEARLRRLSALTVGIVGYGRIGRATANKLRGFGCHVVATARGATSAAPVEVVPLHELLQRSDIVILHVPLTGSSHHLIGDHEFDLIRPGSLVVNVSRGGVIDTEALVRAVSQRDIYASLDVLEDEPVVHPELLASPRVVVTPHVAFSSDASVAELRTKATSDVIRVLASQEPKYPCN